VVIALTTVVALRLLSVNRVTYPLRHPHQRTRLNHPRQRHLRPLRAIQDRLDNVWRKQREAQNTSGSNAVQASASVMLPSCARAALNVPATISGWRNTARNWSMAAASILPAGTRPTGHDPAPCLRTVWLT
jgi:hypothetical protein